MVHSTEKKTDDDDNDSQKEQEPEHQNYKETNDPKQMLRVGANEKQKQQQQQQQEKEDNNDSKDETTAKSSNESDKFLPSYDVLTVTASAAVAPETSDDDQQQEKQDKVIEDAGNNINDEHVNDDDDNIDDDGDDEDNSQRDEENDKEEELQKNGSESSKEFTRITSKDQGSDLKQQQQQKQHNGGLEATTTIKLGAVAVSGDRGNNDTIGSKTTGTTKTADHSPQPAIGTTASVATTASNMDATKIQPGAVAIAGGRNNNDKTVEKEDEGTIPTKNTIQSETHKMGSSSSSSSSSDASTETAPTAAIGSIPGASSKQTSLTKPGAVPVSGSRETVDNTGSSGHRTTNTTSNRTAPIASATTTIAPTASVMEVIRGKDHDNTHNSFASGDSSTAAAAATTISKVDPSNKTMATSPTTITSSTGTATGNLNTGNEIGAFPISSSHEMANNNNNNQHDWYEQDENNNNINMVVIEASCSAETPVHDQSEPPSLSQSTRGQQRRYHHDNNDDNNMDNNDRPVVLEATPVQEIIATQVIVENHNPAPFAPLSIEHVTIDDQSCYDTTIRQNTRTPATRSTGLQNDDSNKYSMYNGNDNFSYPLPPPLTALQIFLIVLGVAVTTLAVIFLIFGVLVPMPSPIDEDWTDCQRIYNETLQTMEVLRGLGLLEWILAIIVVGQAKYYLLESITQYYCYNNPNTMNTGNDNDDEDDSNNNSKTCFTPPPLTLILISFLLETIWLLTTISLVVYMSTHELYHPIKAVEKVCGDLTPFPNMIGTNDGNMTQIGVPPPETPGPGPHIVDDSDNEYSSDDVEEEGIDLVGYFASAAFRISVLIFQSISYGRLVFTQKQVCEGMERKWVKFWTFQKILFEFLLLFWVMGTYLAILAPAVREFRDLEPEA